MILQPRQSFFPVYRVLFWSCFLFVKSSQQLLKIISGSTDKLFFFFLFFCGGGYINISHFNISDQQKTQKTVAHFFHNLFIMEQLYPHFKTRALPFIVFTYLGELTIIFHSSACVLGVHLGKLRHESLLFADDAVLLASMERDLALCSQV